MQLFSSFSFLTITPQVIEDIKRGKTSSDFAAAVAEQVVEMGMLKISGRGGAEHTIPDVRGPTPHPAPAQATRFAAANAASPLRCLSSRSELPVPTALFAPAG